MLPQLAWASGSFGTGAVFNAMALFSLFYMTNFLGIAPALAGTIILVAKLYDGVIDPVIGAISDRTDHRWGPRRIYLLIGSLGVGLTFALFFNLAQFSIAGPMLVLLVTGALLLYSTFYSIFSIPYLAMPPSIAADYHQRTRLMSFRVFFLLLGVTSGSAGAPMLIGMVGGERDGYGAMGIIMAIAATAVGLLAFFSAGWLPREQRLERSAAPSIPALLASPFTDALKVMGHAPFRLLTIIKLCQLGVLSTVLACTPYFFVLVLNLDAGKIGQYYLAFSLSGLLSVPVFRWIISRAGKRETYLALLTLYGLALASWIFWKPGEHEALFYVRAVVIGSFSTGTLLCALSMLPDTMEYDRLASGQSREGIMSGVFTFVENVAGALGPFLIGLLLQANGLIQSRDPATPQPAAVIEAVHWGVSIIPALFCFASIPFLLRYRLDAAALARMQGPES